MSLSNLQRQVLHSTPDIGHLKVDSASEKLRLINPEVNIVTIPELFTERNAEEIISGYDLIIDCTDNLPKRLLINDTCIMLGKKFVFGAVSRFSGQVFSHVPGSACYRCIFDPSAVSSEAELPCSINGILNTVVGITGTIQATEAIKLIVGTGDPLINRMLAFDALTMAFNTFEINPIEDCYCQHG